MNTTGSHAIVAVSGSQPLPPDDDAMSPRSRPYTRRSVRTPDPDGSVHRSDTNARVLDAPLGSPSRPTWRGLLHMVALLAAVPLLVALSIVSDGARTRAAVIVYAAGLCSMLTASTVYHRWAHSLRARAIWRRADHAMIFAAIAGTFTALALSTLGTGTAIAVLVTIWAAAAVGAVVKLTRFQRADRIGSVMYVAMGWAGLLLVPAVWHHRGALAVGLLVAGGVMYTVGAAAFRRQWPTLRPTTFSYHEVWHAFTIAAAGLHLGAVWTVAT
jgi:hemolysin III